MPRGIPNKMKGQPRGKAAIDALPNEGHMRREVLKRRAGMLDEIAEDAAKNAEMYSVDPEKLKEEPEILKHLNFASMMFEVTNPVAGRCYCWVRKDQKAIAEKRNEARFFGVKGAWQVINSGDVESPETKTAEGTREIGDTLLMWISLEHYILIQKRINLMNAYREMNVPQQLADFVREFEGKVQVYATNEDPQSFLTRNKIVGPHRNQGPRGNFLNTEA